VGQVPWSVALTAKYVVMVVLSSFQDTVSAFRAFGRLLDIHGNLRYQASALSCRFCAPVCIAPKPLAMP
jgi:hypothetical protein